MTKNLYFRTVVRRQNHLKTFLLDGFFALSSFPRLLIEVFIRRNFGERYFSVAAAVTIGVILLAVPVTLNALIDFHPDYNGQTPNFWGHYATWYAFLIAFGYFTTLRAKEVKRNPSVFDFRRYSLCSGEIHPFFSTLKPFGWKPNVRRTETLYEPAPFLAGGLLLLLIGQPLGWVFATSSLIYCLGYVAAYNRGDNFVMDKIDEMIWNEELQRAFVDDDGPEKTRGVRFYARKPHGQHLRQKLAKAMVETDPKEAEIAYVE